jgi:hypothetical protein
MKVSELFSDPELIPSNASRRERVMRENFIAIRLRGSQALRGTQNLGEVADTKVSSTKSQLKSELQAAAGKATWVAAQMGTYQSANKLVSLAPAKMDLDLLANYLPDKLIAGTDESDLKAKRTEMIASIVWWATAADPQLLQSQDALLKLVDRRLRAAERMLYYVAINPRSPWPPVDLGNRMFDYPSGRDSIGSNYESLRRPARSEGAESLLLRPDHSVPAPRGLHGGREEQAGR